MGIGVGSNESLVSSLLVRLDMISHVLYDLLHILQYELSPKKGIRLNEGTVVFSIDVDVGHEDVGVANKGRNDRNVSSVMSERRLGQIEESALPVVLDLFEDFEMPVTLAVRGQLFDVSGATIDLLLHRSIEHDIGAHGYYHKNLLYLTRQEALHEFEMLRNAMKKFHLKPRSFVFPRNGVEYLELLSAFGYLCFRGQGDSQIMGCLLKE